MRLHPEVPQPLRVDRYTATFWRREDHIATQPTLTDLTGLLTQLHNLPATGTGLAAWNPIPDLRHRIAAAERAEHVSQEDLAFLGERCDQVEARLSTLRHELPTGVIHGDARLGNLIPSSRGALWCDLDSVTIGPAEWDLVPTAVGQLRFGDDGDIHRRLARAYGFDVTTWTGFPVLREIRELKLITATLPLAASNPAIHAELVHRIASFRSGDTTARWTRYT